MIATFFGHRDAPEKIRYQLKLTMIDLIENYAVDTFLVGHNGRFDKMVLSTLISFKSVYTHIDYYVVYAYEPFSKSLKNTDYDLIDWEHAVFLEELEGTMPKYAISKRNRWMLEKADYVVTYVTHNFGGAAKFKEIAEKKGKKVINIAETE